MPTVKMQDNAVDIPEIKAKLQYVTEARSSTDWHSTPHIHPFTEIFYVTSGQGLFWIEEKTIKVVEDDVILVNANINHTEMKEKGHNFDYIVMGVSGINFETIRQENFSVINFKNHKDEILHYLKTIVKEAINKEEHYQTIINKLLEILLINMMRRESQLELTTELSEKISLECAYVQNYIDKNYQKKITLDSLAAMTHNSKYYLSHAFKEFSGQSIIDYLITRRIEVAKSLLVTTNHTIGSIANMVGYETTSYFSSSFKDRMGVSPLKYRNKFQNKPII